MKGTLASENMPGRYRVKTTVFGEKSRVEIEQTLARYGAIGAMYGTTQTRAAAAFEGDGRRSCFI